ncbi:hypothetical protein FXO38_10736 [Capsicum annuum]|nr:hypothetical protein FXO38_10736 [Capsicum annuum]
MIVPPPAQYYRMTIGLSIYLPSLIPFCSSHAASHSDSTRSIALSDLQLRGTLSGAFDLPTPVNPLTLTRQPGDRDDSAKIYMIPVMKGRMLELEKLHKYALVDTSTITRSASQRFQNLTGIECLKNLRCRDRFKDLLDDAQKKLVKPKWIPKPLWPLDQRHWNSPEYQLLMEKEKRAWASFKGGSLHTTCARSTLAVKEKLCEAEEDGGGNGITNQDPAAAVQFFHSEWGGVIPPCPGDAVRAAKGLGPLDDFSTNDDMKDEDEYNDDDC